MSVRRKRALGAVSVVAALAITGGVAAQFTTSTSSAPQQIGTGTLAITIDNVSNTVWTDDISNLAAGDSVERFLDLRNSGSLKIAGINASQTNTLGDLLTSPSDVSVKFESCTVAWNYTTGVCAGQKAVALDTSSVRSWAAASKAMSTFEDFGAGDIRHLKLTTTLASTATNAVQAKSGKITYTFGAAQRVAGTNGSISDSAGTLQQPSGVTTSVLSDTSVKVDFADTNAGKAAYVVSWGETGNSAVAPQTATVPAGTTSYTVTGLTSGKSYDFTVSASKNGQTAATTPAVATPKPAGPEWSAGTSAGTTLQQSEYTMTPDGSIYSTGGTSGTNSAATRKYVPSTGVWSTVANMPAAIRLHVSQATADGSVYAFGGVDNQGNAQNASFKYTPSTNRWTTVAPMPVKTWLARSVLGNDGKIYVVGGVNEATGLLQRYDPATNTWAQLASMPTKTQYSAVQVTPDGSIYVFGGLGSKVVQKYSPSTNTWSTMEPVPTGTWVATSSVSADGSIYLYGGRSTVDTSQSLDVIQKYSPSTNTWSSAGTLPWKRYDMKSITDARGGVYFIGGNKNGVLTGDVDYLG